MRQGDSIFGGIRRVAGSDSENSALQQQLDEALRQLAAVPILNGSLITGIKTTGIDTDIFVQHGLGREARGFILVNSDYPIMLYKSSTANALPGRQIVLRANYSAVGVRTFSAWFF